MAGRCVSLITIPALYTKRGVNLTLCSPWGSSVFQCSFLRANQPDDRWRGYVFFVVFFLKHCWAKSDEKKFVQQTVINKFVYKRGRKMGLYGKESCLFLV